MTEGPSPHSDTIAALATPSGRGGVGIVRVSGPGAQSIAVSIVGRLPRPRYACFSAFYDEEREVIDEGLVLSFPGPNSFTGEDTVEFQGHGGPIILDRLLRRILSLGARLANPGEFSERAFLNGKIDLTQAEAIADLIDSTSVQAAASAVRSLQGLFSRKINSTVEQLTELRAYVEGAIDFPEEEVDFLSDGRVNEALNKLIAQIEAIEDTAAQGALQQNGMRVVIAGRPNAGKSSLMNALSGQDTAIVTDIAGTTRDVLREQVNLDGMPVHFVDTAGLRQSDDPIEQIGIKRALAEVALADRVLLVVDSSTTEKLSPKDICPELTQCWQSVKERLTVVRSKIDLSGEKEGEQCPNSVLGISTVSSKGLNTLREHLKACMGYQGSAEGLFSARRRHLDALARARENIVSGKLQLESTGASELLAEELRLAQKSLGEITGEVTSDDLLGLIFSSFCIGK